MPLTGKVCSEDRSNWDHALALYREQLRFYLDYLVPGECDLKILAEIESEVRDRSVPDDFKLRFLSRALVQKVIKHLRECTHQKDSSPRSPEDWSNSVESLPAQERLVYFMRDILEYCTRDTSLMIGITDAKVEKLLSFARRRIDMTDGPSSLEIETPGGTYFRWKFVDLHVS
jgi:hypothetical protein